MAGAPFYCFPLRKVDCILRTNPPIDNQTFIFALSIYFTFCLLEHFCFDSTGYAVILETNIPSTVPGNYLTARYFHMKYAPTVSRTVNASTKIGDTGTTGNSTGAHLHIDISPIAWGNGSVTVNNALDPIAFLHPQNSSGTELDFNPSVYRTR